MIVCHCKGITDRDLRRALREGAFGRDETAEASRAGSDCGGCRALVDEIIGKHGQQRPEPPKRLER